MKKRNWILTLVLMISLMLFTSVSLADAGIDEPALPVVQVEAEYADELQLALDALQAHTPGAVVDYAVRERDDGIYEWDLFFTLNGQLGQAEIHEDGFVVRRVVLFDKPLDGLTAAEIAEALKLEKGEITIISLELDRDDGRLRYDGEATLNGKLYEFEISIAGKIVEWERD